MNSLRIIKTSLVASALMISGVCNAKPIDKSGISMRCELVYQELYQLYESNKSAPCSDKVLISRDVMKGARELVQSERYSDALSNAYVAYGHLNNIFLSSNECQYFSPLVKLPIFDVKYLVGELEKASG